MSDKGRLDIFPTRMALTAIKIRKKGAEKGHSLLKKKSDALTMRFRSILGKIAEEKAKMGVSLNEASFSLAKAKYDAGEIAPTVIESCSTATYRLRMGTDNVAGVKLPIFKRFNDSVDDSLAALLQDVYPDVGVEVRARLPVGHWDDAANRRQFFDQLAEEHSVEEADDWKHVSRDAIILAGGGGLLARYSGSVLEALRDAYPEKELGEVGTRKKVAKGHWQKVENRKAAVEAAAKQLGVKDVSDWKKVTTRQAARLPGMRGLLKHYGDSLFAALAEVYPDTGLTPLDCRQSVPQGYWDEMGNRRAFMDAVAKKHNVQSASDWRKVHTSHVQEMGGSGLLTKYPSFAALLQDVYSDRQEMAGTDALELRTVLPGSFWEEPENIRRFLDGVKRELFVEKAEDWLRVSEGQVREMRGGGLLMKMKLVEALEVAYPNEKWQAMADAAEGRQGTRTKRAAQRHLLLSVRHLLAGPPSVQECA